MLFARLFAAPHLSLIYIDQNGIACPFQITERCRKSFSKGFIPTIWSASCYWTALNSFSSKGHDLLPSEIWRLDYCQSPLIDAVQKYKYCLLRSWFFQTSRYTSKPSSSLLLSFLDSSRPQPCQSALQGNLPLHSVLERVTSAVSSHVAFPAVANAALYLAREYVHSLLILLVCELVKLFYSCRHASIDRSS